MRAGGTLLGSAPSDKRNAALLVQALGGPAAAVIDMHRHKTL